MTSCESSSRTTTASTARGSQRWPKSAAKFGDVRVVAPDVEQSSAGHAITASRPVRFRATPHLRGHRGLPRQRHAGRLRRARAQPVGSCRRRPFRNQPRAEPRQLHVALGHARRSQAGGAAGHTRHRAERADRRRDVRTSRSWLPGSSELLETLLANDEPEARQRQLPVASLAGLRWTSQSVDQYNGKVVTDEDPMGRPVFWFTVIPLEELSEGTDLWAVERGLRLADAVAARPDGLRAIATSGRLPGRRRPRQPGNQRRLASGRC